MKKFLLGTIIAAAFMVIPVTSFAQLDSKHPLITQDTSPKSIKVIEKTIKKTTTNLNKIEKDVDSYLERNKREGKKFKDLERSKHLNRILNSLDKEDEVIDNVYFMTEYLPVGLVKANIDNDIKNQRVSQKILVIIFQTMADEIEADIEFKVAGENSQTLMIIGNEPVKMTMDSFSEELKVAMLYLGFEDVLFTDLKKDVRLEKIKAQDN